MLSDRKKYERMRATFGLISGALAREVIKKLPEGEQVVKDVFKEHGRDIGKQIMKPQDEPGHDRRS